MPPERRPTQRDVGVPPAVGNGSALRMPLAVASLQIGARTPAIPGGRLVVLVWKTGSVGKKQEPHSQKNCGAMAGAGGCDARADRADDPRNGPGATKPATSIRSPRPRIHPHTEVCQRDNRAACAGPIGVKRGLVLKERPGKTMSGDPLAVRDRIASARGDDRSRSKIGLIDP